MLTFLAANLQQTPTTLAQAMDVAHQPRRRAFANVFIGLCWHMINVNGLGRGRPGMRHPKTGRIIAISASACLLLALGCGLLGLALQQRMITLTDVNVELGPLSIIMQAPRPSVCPSPRRRIR